jgi:hypothetical protein
MTSIETDHNHDSTKCFKGVVSKRFLKCTIVSVLALVAGFVPPALADDDDAGGSASFVAPITILSAQDLSFGVITLPPSGTCTYTLPPSGSAVASGPTTCAFMSGLLAPARFELSCGPNVLTRFELVYEDLAPAGAHFASGTNPMKIDASASGGVLQVSPCDSDGTSIVLAGGQLTVTSDAQDGFSGRVGTILLEASYE